MKIKKLLKISDLNRKAVEELLGLGLKSRRRLEKPSTDDVKFKSQKKQPVALIFLEPSTRTRVSFERACQVTGRPAIVLSGKESSFEKGETLVDTVHNLRALGIEDFVIRTGETNGLEDLRAFENVGVINAGDGVGEHPTQALLDLLTLLRFCTPAKNQVLKQLQGFKLGIVGDLRRSRVARSWAELAALVGIELTLISPSAWRPEVWGETLNWSSDMGAGIRHLDAVMALRVQKERMEGSLKSSVSDDELRRFQISADTLSKTQFLLHPGPVNWGVELDVSVQSDARSLILEQVRSGLAIRATLISLME